MPLTHKNMASEARTIADMAHDAHGANGCPVEIAVDFAAQMAWDDYDGDDIHAHQEWLRIRSIGTMPYFRFVYNRRYSQLSNTHPRHDQYCGCDACEKAWSQ